MVHYKNIIKQLEDPKLPDSEEAAKEKVDDDEICLPEICVKDEPLMQLIKINSEEFI